MRLEKWLRNLTDKKLNFLFKKIPCSDFKKVWEDFKVNDTHPQYPQRLLAAVIRYNSLHLGAQMSLDEIEDVVKEFIPRIEADIETITCEPAMDDLFDIDILIDDDLEYLEDDDLENLEAEEPSCHSIISKAKSWVMTAAERMKNVFSPSRQEKRSAEVLEEEQDNLLLPSSPQWVTFEFGMLFQEKCCINCPLLKSSLFELPQWVF